MLRSIFCFNKGKPASVHNLRIMVAPGAPLVQPETRHAYLPSVFIRYLARLVPKLTLYAWPPAGGAHSFDELIRAARERRPASSVRTASALADDAAAPEEDEEAVVATADSGGAREPPGGSGAGRAPGGGDAADETAEAPLEPTQDSPSSERWAAAMPDSTLHGSVPLEKGAQEDDERKELCQEQVTRLNGDGQRRQELGGGDPASMAGLTQPVPGNCSAEDTPAVRDRRDADLKLVLDPAAD